jgi:hypothetical protein
MVMPADNAGLWVGYMAGKYEGRVGHLYSPGYERPPIPFLPYALDNGRFSCWSKGSEWNEAGYLAMLETHGAAALWCIVPDRVGNRDETLREWDRWAPRMSGLRLALAVQDGMTADDVPAEAAVVFVGGTTEWKRRTLHSWAERFRRVHVGRINTEKWLWECHAAGVESCDGTGWFRGDQVQFRGLLRYFDRSTRGAKQASLRKVTAAAIRWARHELRYGRMASDFKPGEAMLKMPLLTAQFVKTIGARKALLNAVEDLSRLA